MKKDFLVNVIGLGYIGLPTALMLSTHGINVVGTDYKKELVASLSKGLLTFEENGVLELLCDSLKKGIKFSFEYQKADMYIVSVPTPYDKLTKKIDASFVVKAVEECLNICDDEAILVIESTISPGTIDKYVRPLVSLSRKKINLCHAPERIIPGNMVYELEHNSRTIGADDKNIGEIVKEIYSSFCRGEIAITDIKTAEMTKVIENTFRAVNIAFANELLKLCYENNMNVYEIIKICNMHPRVNILNPGPGVGGHCIPVDPWFLVGDYPMETKIIGQSMHINEKMPEFVIKQIKEIMVKEGITDTNKVGLYGLTYKENVDDIRESPTLQLLEFQKKHLGAPLKVYDPHIHKNVVENQYIDFDEFLSEIDLLVVMIAHSHLKENLDKIKSKIIFDTRNSIFGTPKLYKLGIK